MTMLALASQSNWRLCGMMMRCAASLPSVATMMLLYWRALRSRFKDAAPTSRRLTQQRTMKVTDLYLVLYNLLSCAGWAYILNLTIASYFQHNLKPSEFWSQIGAKPFVVGPVSFGGYGALQVIQTAAFLEVVHVAIGLVPSSLFANIMQVIATRAVVGRFSPAHTLRAGWISPHVGLGALAPIGCISSALLSVPHGGQLGARRSAALPLPRRQHRVQKL
jgi:hypothetical protein